MQYVRGSHKWPGVFKPNGFVTRQTLSSLGLSEEDGEQRELPNIEGNRDDYDIVTHPSEPGDVIVHHSRLIHIPEAADGLKAKAKHGRKWLDGLIAGREFIAGDQISLADIVLYCCMDFGRGVGQPLDDDTPNLSAWFEHMDARPSARESKHSAAEQIAVEISEMVPSLSAVTGRVSVT